jgi:ABC-type dipeptide/oligopeptide/nickel transport system permease subunit
LFPIFNSADFLEIYGEFVKPRFYTHDAMNNEYAWNINWYSAGINLKVTGRFDLKAFTLGMRLGGGYYWAEARQYNSGFAKSDWRGYNINFELDIMKYAWFYPLDLFIQYSLYYPTQDFAFNTGDGTINLGRDMFSGLSVGLRLCLWWEDKY